jgi:hypothetical protein
VKLGKLFAAARRELTASPKKAAVLALLLAAAAWFWGPIMWRMAAGAKPSAETRSQAEVVSSTSRSAASDPADPRVKPVADWRQLLAARRQDPLAQPAQFDPRWPQPFQFKALATDAAEGPAAQIALTPTQAGLVLESILYGKSKRAAMISGEIYREGSEVAVAAATGAPVTFQVIHIDRASVALERYGRTYRLEFPRPRLTHSQTGHISPQPLTPSADQP